jgi:hypothetical protein
MYMPRDFILRSKHGYAVKFEANEPARVPYQVIDEAIAIGAVFVNADEQKILVEEPKELETPDLGFEREQKIYNAMIELANENDAEKFTPGGKPKLAVLTEMVGYDVDQKETSALWKKVMQARANAD